MNMITKHRVLQAHLKKWLACKGNNKERGALNKQLAESLKMNEKSIGRSMKRLQLKDKSQPERRGRPVVYGADVNAALSRVWEEMGCPCAENIPREAVEEHVKYFKAEDDWKVNNDVTLQLFLMSEGTKKLRIAAFRKKRGMGRGRSATVSSPLKGIIPIRKSHTWNNLPPGYVQADSVVHCGDLLTGNVVYSVGCVDFATYWSEYTAQWNKGQEETLKSLRRIRECFPFPLREIHPDTGNEFINYHVRNWAVRENIDMTRSEPYKKNDNMCIEERNNSIARKHLGYVRLDNPLFVSLASEILRVSCLLHNHFRPVRRMISKERVGSKWKRTFEKSAKTPYWRVLKHSKISPKHKKLLRADHETQNPLELNRKLGMLKDKLGRALAKQKNQATW